MDRVLEPLPRFLTRELSVRLSSIPSDMAGALRTFYLSVEFNGLLPNPIRESLCAKPALRLAY